uniref:Perilipin n=1 Tax=Gopherus agassizii TaxID=38772 RepID=A0A452I5H5_9SAUR
WRGNGADLPINLVNRVASLPLVSAAYDMVSTTYTSIKETHPVIRSICDVAETGVRTIASATVSGALPVLDQQEPLEQLILTASDYTCKSLDKLEEKLPVLQQPGDQVASDAKELVSSTLTGAKDVVCSTDTGVKDPVTSMVGVTKGAVQESMEQSYYVRLGSLSSMLHQRAYQHALGKMRQARQRTLEVLSTPLTTMERAKQAVDQKAHDGQEKLQQMWLEWHKGQPGFNEDNGSLQPEVSLFSCSGELSESILTQTQEQVTKAQESLDELLEYVVQNAPLTWIVGPFAPAGDSTEKAEVPAEAEKAEA